MSAPGADERARRALEIFDEVADLAADQQTARLQLRCGNDASLRARVEAMLAADSSDGEPFSADSLRQAAMLAEAGEAAPRRSLTGEQIGVWRIIDVIGHGGMGAVYSVERVDGAYAKQAALKLIRASADTPAARERFLRERQILAGLQHPNIATLLDGGISAAGEPYFVMERIDGVPIDRWCDERALGLRERVVLFLQVLDAVRHAHRNLIVHRDLKPSNMLVDADGKVKLLDFGIAKQLQAASATMTSDRALTLEYASPEQLHAAPITTATDLWQLGIVLHRLLSGTHPFGFTVDTSAIRQLREAEREPEPLTRAAAHVDPEQAARRGGLTPVALARALRGNLATIVQTCLRRDPEARYASADALATDLRAWLDDRPITAVRLPRRERARLWLRRNGGLAAAGTAIVLALLAGAAVALWQAREARAQTRIAERESASARATLKFLTDTLTAAAPEEAMNTQVSVRDLLDKARSELERDTLQPAVRQSVQRLLGGLYLSFSEPKTAAELLEQGLHGVLPSGRAEALLLAQSLDDYSSALGSMERGDESMAAARRAAELRNRYATGDPLERIRTHDMMGYAWYRVGDHGKAEAEWKAALGMARGMPAPPIGVISDTYQMLSGMLHANGKSREALGYADEGLAFLDRHRVPAAVPIRVNLLRSRSEAQGGLGDPVGAEQTIRRAIAIQQQVVGDSGLRMDLLQNTLGVALNDQGRFKEALDVLTRNSAQDAAVGMGPVDAAISLSNRASVHESAGDYAAATSLLQRAMAELEQAGKGPDDQVSRVIGRVQARVVGLAGQPRDALARLQGLRARALRPEGSDSMEYAMTTWQMAVMARRLHDPALGEPLLQEAREAWSALVHSAHPIFAHALRAEASFAQDRGDLAHAETAQREALRLLEAAGSMPVDVAIGQAELAAMRMARGDRAEARVLLGRALPVLRDSVLPAEINRADAEALAKRLGMR